MLYQLLFLIFGTLSMIYAIRFCSDFSVSKNPMFQGIIREAKIIGFYTGCTWRAVEEFAVIEYLEEGQVIKSKVERAKKDKIGDEIVILAGMENFTVRYSYYVPFDMKYKEACLISVFPIFMAHSVFIFKERYVAVWIVLIALGVCYFLYHPFWLYHIFYSK